MSPILASPLFWRQFRLLLIHLRKLIKFILIILILIISLIFQFTLIHSLVHADNTLCPIIEIIRCGIIITGEFSWLVVLLVLLVFTIQIVVFYTLCQIIICPIINVCSVLFMNIFKIFLYFNYLFASQGNGRSQTHHSLRFGCSSQDIITFFFFLLRMPLSHSLPWTLLALLYIIL